MASTSDPEPAPAFPPTPAAIQNLAVEVDTNDDDSAYGEET
jgi:hypothetical protein